MAQKASWKGDATFFGSETLVCTAYCLWAVGFGTVTHLGDWCRSWVSILVFVAGNGLSSMDVWYSISLDMDEPVL